MTHTAERALWHCDWTVARYSEADVAELTRLLERAPAGPDFAAAGADPYSVGEVEGNLLVTTGLGRITSLIIGGGGQAATNTATRIGVGNGAGSAAVGDTDLSASSGSTNRWFRPMDAGFPTQAAGLITLQATYGTSDGNFAWNEFGVDIGAPTVSAGAPVGALLLNHKTGIAQGTKTAGQSWVATATITIA